ncbi:LytR/AlgR family response regulator transcription factor [Vibrio intestinalis]|uniref:LytR/AlgR family response regulator transcription factor n=1 Tax=Vibrio intestinalis TaxID=2933291 RepID=UPI0021A7EBA5|nr:LytTR family DNA-binding domain-containing protein [Vibrio intestinalis]
MLNVILIDDEPSAIQAIESTLKSLDGIEIIGCYTNSDEGISAILELKPDVVFLDIEMPIHNGLTVAKITEHIEYSLVYITAYPGHALSAFETNVTDYILKPVRPSRLIQCIGKIHKRSSSVNTKTVLAVSDGATTYNLDYQYINLIESLGRYQQIHLTPLGAKTIEQERIVVEQSISSFEEQLPQTEFYRVHRSYIIRLDRVKKIISRDRNKFITLQDFSDVIPVSRSKFKELSDQYLV